MTYPTPPGPPIYEYPRRRYGLWIALAVAVVIIVVLAVLLVTQRGGDQSPAAQQTTASAPATTVAPLPTGAAPPAPPQSASMTCEGYTASVDESSQPGWHAAINRLGLAYAAPPDWTVAVCGTRTGWVQPCPEGQCVIRELGAVSTVANPTCPKQNLGIAGVTRSANPDIRAALDEEMQTVSPIYTRDGNAPNVEFAPIREFQIGPHPAVQVVATVRDIQTTECAGPGAYHSIVVTTVPGVEGSVVFVISLREGATVTPNANVINEMVATLKSPA
ncbi:Uncharacterised protein [Mycolicibacterium phlei]|uniref:DUF8017 domain-containing protein n=1 Tax=Mycolicibacterium phlei DSM 43239 = CCUG 21000 TaxID=1226750 RepID=A0A5N5V4M6_MYCPH|nr:hypothetical protein [Mycolicibacterium phlei]VEG08473.1 Uncharacterised protein [Mycobacteroides chelonae]AMO60353.1 hypothetical protein MPHLCCUG_01529 [Mycolicibacterium phlei]EID17762.1 hypothetical protein MPHLEI_02823 [Mycolicibacterium phlei RIVM601174]KAB7756736.1 hypothetical protein MPHL21000_11100 [Mycolicibacterium phlei DSM 43239 = CCUG 21000]KXW62038.1 hypothetical protein MPHL43072_10215 [Mycolicibacterium phlei DSM 43072]